MTFAVLAWCSLRCTSPVTAQVVQDVQAAWTKLQPVCSIRDCFWSLLRILSIDLLPANQLHCGRGSCLPDIQIQHPHLHRTHNQCVTWGCLAGVRIGLTPANQSVPSGTYMQLVCHVYRVCDVCHLCSGPAKKPDCRRDPACQPDDLNLEHDTIL